MVSRARPSVFYPHTRSALPEADIAAVVAALSSSTRCEIEDVVNRPGERHSPRQPANDIRPSLINRTRLVRGEQYHQDWQGSMPSNGYTSKVRLLDRYKVVGFIR